MEDVGFVRATPGRALVGDHPHQPQVGLGEAALSRLALGDQLLQFRNGGAGGKLTGAQGLAGEQAGFDLGGESPLLFRGEQRPAELIPSGVVHDSR